jgi:hypothetical protein
MGTSDAAPSVDDRTVIRGLAARWADIAAQPVMADRKRQWRAVHDLQPERPMILFETSSIDGYVRQDELLCVNPTLRAVEKTMRDNIRHAEEVGDDIVLEPYLRIGWDIESNGFGVDVVTTEAVVPEDEVPLGYTFDFPIREPHDTVLLHERVFAVNRAKTLARSRFLEDAFGDLLPVRVGNYDQFLTEPPGESWAGNYFIGLTWQIYRFIGNDGLLYWVYDAPETIHWLMEYMTQDRERMFAYLERQGLIVPNTDNQMAGPRAYGYVSELPGPASNAPARLSDVWCWADSQETTTISPAMYREFVLPYIARLTARFGLVYYGCCEPVHDRLNLIMEAIPNLRSVSVSAWSDFQKVADMLGRQYVYSRKPNPTFMTGTSPDWDLVERDLRDTYTAARDCSVELLFRDLYAIGGDRARLARWVGLARSVFQT